VPGFGLLIIRGKLIIDEPQWRGDDGERRVAFEKAVAITTRCLDYGPKNGPPLDMTGSLISFAADPPHQ